jgi:hypothetical protein
MHDQIVDFLEYTIRNSYAWLTTNDKVVGSIVYILHVEVFSTLMLLIFVSHIFPYMWFQTGVFVLVFTVWLQHVVLKTCVFSSLEIRLVGDASVCMIDSLLLLLNIPRQRETREGVTLLLSTTMMLFLGMELMARML